jgi:benzoate membrane transport protein
MADRAIPVSTIAAGLLSAFVGFASSFAVILKGLQAVGATPVQAACGLMALSIAMGVCAIWLSLRTKLPISIAWSTPGGALLATTGAVEGGFPVAVGAFIVTGLLLFVAGWWKPLGRWVAAIPGALANAMLAGVLLGLCLAPVRAVAAEPVAALAIIAVWAVVARLNRLYAVPAAVVALVVIIAFTVPVPMPDTFLPQVAVVLPVFTLAGLVGIAVPLFIVTMASQNLPGLAVLKANGYEPEAGPLIRTTGLFTIAGAPFGAHAVNLAAITAALCAGPDVHPDPARRYWAAVIAGATYIVFGIAAGAAMGMNAAVPPLLLEAVAGLALLGALAGALTAALSDSARREAAVVTFLVAASGLTLFGIGGAFWGLIAGGALLLLARWRAA